MADADPPSQRTIPPFAAMLRRARAARRMSQLDLALECELSARHLSFLETGRAQPSREMVFRLADGLLLPLATRNALLQAAGFAPAFPASALDSAALEPFRAVLGEMIARHSPLPALLCDRHWTIRDANASAMALLGPLGDGSGELNVPRLLANSPAAGALIVNYAEVLDEMAARIRLEALEAGGDPVLARLLADLDAARRAHPLPAALPRRPVVPIIVASPLGALSFLSTIAHFGTSEDVTVRDLRLELLFPADDATREAMTAFA
jgi:transcriptional regulator with XRE-family HTH domain